MELLLYDSSKFKFPQNCSILKSSIKFTIESERFSCSLIQENIAHTCIFSLFVFSISNMHINYLTAFPIKLVYIWDL